MSSKGILIFLIGIIGISGTIFTNLFRFGGLASENLSKTYNYQLVSNIAQSGANMAVRQIVNAPDWRTGFSNFTMFSGKLNVRVVDTTYNGTPVIKVVSVGTVDYTIKDWETNGSTIQDTTICFIKIGFIPATVKAAITTNNDIKTLGLLEVDGRNHKIDGTLISNTGTFGIWTTQTLTQSGASTIGGTNLGVDIAPAKTGNEAIIKTSQPWPGGYPSSPDSILGGPANGYPEGTLKAVAQSGINGSQYCTNPSTLHYPLTGVTYVELPNGDVTGMNIQGSGTLIVHNTSLNAKMKNLNFGTFTGLMIADDIIHIHTNIIGALIGLSPHPSEGNTIGNGDGIVKYSSKAILMATNLAPGSLTNGGSMSKVVAWIE